MKKLFCLLCACALLLSLAGCAGGGSGPAEPSAEPDTPSQSAVDSAAAATVQEITPMYPEMMPYPDEADYRNADGELDQAYYEAIDKWWQSSMALHDQPEGYADGLEPFFTDSIRQVLSDAGDANRVYSPLNVYMALGMVAEITDGESRDQVLALLGSEDIDALRTQANAIWNANYLDDGASVSILASSLWLNDAINFKQDTLQSLADNYYAASCWGTMGSDAMNQALRDWVNVQTGGLLQDQTEGLSLDPDTILALATTVYFRAKWTEEFDEDRTAPDTFHAASGDMTCDFMHQDSDSLYYWGDSFSAVGMYMESGHTMWLLLPNEGVSPEALLQDDQFMEFLLSNKYDWPNNKYYTVHLSVPKFDVASDLDLIPSLQALGVTDVFDYTTSDFTPLTDDVDEIYVSQAEHAARVAIDEHGCTATAVTVIMGMGAGGPEGEVDFTVDRPFLFAITGPEDLPMFVGVVNTPTL